MDGGRRCATASRRAALHPGHLEREPVASGWAEAAQLSSRARRPRRRRGSACGSGSPGTRTGSDAARPSPTASLSRPDRGAPRRPCRTFLTQAGRSAYGLPAPRRRARAAATRPTPDLGIVKLTSNLGFVRRMSTVFRFISAPASRPGPGRLLVPVDVLPVGPCFGPIRADDANPHDIEIAPNSNDRVIAGRRMLAWLFRKGWGHVPGTVVCHWPCRCCSWRDRRLLQPRS